MTSQLFKTEVNSMKNMLTDWSFYVSLVKIKRGDNNVFLVEIYNPTNSNYNAQIGL